MIVAEDALTQIRRFYGQGRYLDAYRLARDFAPFADWEGPEAQITAARLSLRLGSDRLCRYLIARAYRKYRDHPAVAYYYSWSYLANSDCIRLLEFTDRFDLYSIDSIQLRADWLALRARGFSLLRDFDRAHKCIQESLELAGQDRAWLHCERSYLLHREDRYDEALEAAQVALEISPHFRPAVQFVGYLYSIRNEEERALGFLAGQADHLQSGEVCSQLSDFAFILQLYDTAEHYLEQTEQYFPLADKDQRKSMAASWAEISGHRRLWDLAIKNAEAAGGKYYGKIAQNIRSNRESGKRVCLDVGFQRQHHDTCAPATLSVLTAFWNRAVDHLELSEEICYDGTPGHESRNWAETEGWCVREFTLSSEVAVALIDRGLPFALTTISPGSGHMQAVIGYDTARGVLEVRDPYTRQDLSFLIDETLQYYASTGPSCLLIVPPEKAFLLDGVDLPDAPLYDLLYQVQRALHEHRRGSAVEVVQQMKDSWPDHRLTLLAGLNLAGYDRSPDREEACLRKLLALYPDDINFFLRLYWCLQHLAPRHERLRLLRERATAEKTSPLIWLELAEELLEDARELNEAAWWLRRCIRRGSGNPRNYFALAGVLWNQRDFGRSLKYYRAAATLADKTEHYCQSYFIACRHFKTTKQALGFLKKRLDRYGHQAHGPACTAFWAYEVLDEEPKGFALLKDAVDRLPDSQELRCYAADALGRHGRFARAQELLDEAKGQSHPEIWAHYQADLFLYQGHLEEALECYLQVHQVSPSDLPAIRQVALLLAQTKGRTEAIVFLEQCLEDFPYYQDLHELYLSWLPPEDLDRKIDAVRKIIAINPRNDWAQRELVSLLTQRGDYESAFEESKLACELAPGSPFYFNIFGDLCAASRRMDEARAAYRQGVMLAADNDYAATQLMKISDTADAKKETLGFIYDEFERQVIFGDGILKYRLYAANIIDSEELLTKLKVALDARPDLWQTWFAYAQQLTQTNRLDEGEKVAREACERFPLLPRAWVELAHICRVRLETGQERAALEKALEISPGWVQPMFHLAESYERQGDFETSRRFIERALAHDRLDGRLHGYLAFCQWELGEKKDALEKIETALELDPTYDWGWDRLRDWSVELGQDDRYRTFSERLTRERPGEPLYWMRYSHVLDIEAEFDARLAAVEKAISLQSHSADLHFSKAQLLSAAYRFDEALEVCRDPRWGRQVPAELQWAEILIEDARGDREASTELLEKFLENHPGDIVGCQLLCDYHREAGRLDEYLQASDQLVKMAPHDAMSYGYRVHALISARPLDSIEEDCKRAIELDPSYKFAGWQLFSLYLERKEFDQAEQVLERVRRHWPPDFYLSQRILQCVNQNHWDEAVRLLREMAVLPALGREEIDSAITALTKGNLAYQTYEALHGLVKDGTVHPNAAYYFGILSSTPQKHSEARRLLSTSAISEEPFQSAAIGYLEQLGTDKNKTEMKSLIAGWDSPSEIDTGVWTASIFAMLMCEMDREIEQWMKDYQKREDIRPIHLVYGIIAAIRNGRLLDTKPLLEDALQRPPDSGRELLVLFKSLMLIADNDLEQAREWIDQSNPGMLEGYYGDLHKLLERTLRVTEKSDSDRTAPGVIAMLIDRYRWDESRRSFVYPARHCVEAIARHRRDMRGWIRKQYRKLWYYRVPLACYKSRVLIGIGLGILLYILMILFLSEVD